MGGFEAEGVLRNQLICNAKQLFCQAYQRPDHSIRLSIKARIDDGKCDAKHDGCTIVTIVDRHDTDLSQLGFTLARGCSILSDVQSALVSNQVAR